MRRTFLIPTLAAVAILTAVATVFAQKYTGSPVTKDRLLKVVRSKQFAVPVIVKQIKISGVDFELTAAVGQELRAAGAEIQILEAVDANYRYAGTARGRTKSMPAAPRDLAAEKYDQLYFQGVELLTRLNPMSTPSDIAAASRSTIDLGTQAIRAAPARFEAYTLVAAGNLIVQNFGEAERYAQLAIDRGGSVAIPVYHLAGTPHREFLHVGSGFVTVQSDQKFFEFDRGQVSGLRQEDPYMMGGIMVAVFSMTTYKDGRQDVWYFAPGTTGTVQEAQMIIRLVQRNCISGR